VKYLDLVILAGGKGTRIRNLTHNKPKPLAKIGKYTFLDLLLSNVSKYHFRKIIILAGFKGKQLYIKYHNKKVNLIKIECIIEKKPLGTGGAINKIKNKLTNNFFVINGDTISDFNFYDLIKSKKKKKSVLALTKSKFSNRGNNIRNLYLDKDKVVKIAEKQKKHIFKSSGVCLLDKSIFQNITETKFSLEDKLLSKLIKKKEIIGYKKKFFFYDIGTKSDFINAKKKLLNHLMRPAVFFDRDNTINADTGYTHKYKDFKFINNSYNALKFLSNKNISIFIITNQAGIGKGLFTEDEFINLHLKLKKMLIDKKIFINEVKYCPYHPQASIKEYRKISSLRKPNNLMIKQIFDKFVIDKNKTIMIGDHLKDQACAKKSKLKFQFVKKNLLMQIKNSLIFKKKVLKI